MGEFIGKDELNGVEEIGFSGTISSDDDVVFRGKGLHHSLVPIGPEPLNDYLNNENRTKSP